MAPWHYGQKHSAGNRRAGLGVLWIASGGHRYQLEIFGAAADNLFRCAGHPDWLGGMAGQRRESLGVKSTTSWRCAKLAATLTRVTVTKQKGCSPSAAFLFFCETPTLEPEVEAAPEDMSSQVCVVGKRVLWKRNGCCPGDDSQVCAARHLLAKIRVKKFSL